MSTVAEQPPASPSPVVPPPAEPPESIGDYARRWVRDVRAGELGSLPILVGIVLIAIYFQTRNSNFLTAGNIVNLIVQMAAFAVIGMGITWVLLIGEIDLSIGFVSGMGGVITAKLLLPGGASIPTSVALIAGLGAGLAIGLIQGAIFARIGVPSFVVTLAGLLIWNGVVLIVIGSSGTVVIQDNFVNGIANNFLSDIAAWIVLEGAVVAYAVVQLLGLRARRKAGVPTDPVAVVALKVGALAVLVGVVLMIVNSNRGVPYVGLLMAGLLIFWTYVAKKTRFGRHVYAVGGNAEAARRAGINVSMIRIACFGISGLMAALGGIILASRLSSVDTNAGGGDILLNSIAAAVIGGTSLFGGRGEIKGAVLGAVVIASIANGLGLLNVSSGTKFVVTGLVLLAAVMLDSITRRGREQSGRA
jgi:D-xylose transport system permease protein